MVADKSNRVRVRRFDSPAQEAYLNLWRTYDLLRQVEESVFEPFGLTAQQYNVLRLLRGEANRTLPTLEIGRRLVSRAPDITRLVDRLVERTWVVRLRRESNRRVVEIVLQRAGEDLLDQVDPVVRALNDRQLGHLSTTELAELTKLLQRARAPFENPDGCWRISPNQAQGHAVVATTTRPGEKQNGTDD